MKNTLPRLSLCYSCYFRYLTQSALCTLSALDILTGSESVVKQPTTQTQTPVRVFLRLCLTLPESELLLPINRLPPRPPIPLEPSTSRRRVWKKVVFRTLHSVMVSLLQRDNGVCFAKQATRVFCCRNRKVATFNFRTPCPAITSSSSQKSRLMQTILPLTSGAGLALSVVPSAPLPSDTASELAELSSAAPSCGKLAQSAGSCMRTSISGGWFSTTIRAKLLGTHFTPNCKASARRRLCPRQRAAENANTYPAKRGKHRKKGQTSRLHVSTTA